MNTQTEIKPITMEFIRLDRHDEVYQIPNTEDLAEGAILLLESKEGILHKHINSYLTDSVCTFLPISVSYIDDQGKAIVDKIRIITSNELKSPSSLIELGVVIGNKNKALASAVYKRSFLGVLTEVCKDKSIGLFTVETSEEIEKLCAEKRMQFSTAHSAIIYCAARYENSYYNLKCERIKNFPTIRDGHINCTYAEAMTELGNDKKLISKFLDLKIASDLIRSLDFDKVQELTTLVNHIKYDLDRMSPKVKDKYRYPDLQNQVNNLLEIINYDVLSTEEIKLAYTKLGFAGKMSDITTEDVLKELKTNAL